MDYSLAKQLKNAGFPQHQSDYYYGNNNQYRNGDGKPVVERREDENETAFSDFLCDIPTLEELIEACNHFPDHPFASLIQLGSTEKWGQWEAEVWWSDIKGEGSTPTEAVARLWLALNKK